MAFHGVHTESVQRRIALIVPPEVVGRRPRQSPQVVDDLSQPDRLNDGTTSVEDQHWLVEGAGQFQEIVSNVSRRDVVAVVRQKAVRMPKPNRVEFLLSGFIRRKMTMTVRSADALAKNRSARPCRPTTAASSPLPSKRTKSGESLVP